MYSLPSFRFSVDLSQESVKICLFLKKVRGKVWLFRGKAVLLHPLSRTMPLAAGSDSNKKRVDSVDSFENKRVL